MIGLLVSTFRDLRSAANLTIEDVSRLLGIEPAKIAAYDRGDLRPLAREIQVLAGFATIARRKSPQVGRESGPKTANHNERRAELTCEVSRGAYASGRAPNYKTVQGWHRRVGGLQVRRTQMEYAESMAKTPLRKHTRNGLGQSSRLTAAASKAEDAPVNRSLHAAKAAKQDEFYTQYVDIQKEVEANRI